jgi:hypothetical protein
MSQKMTMLGGSQPISKGDIPSNIRSGRAIRLLEELESLRASDSIKKAEKFVLNLYKRTLSIIGQNYSKNDDRLIKILGEDKKFQIDSFKAVALERPYDVQLVPSSALPQTPAARMATVMELMQIPAIQEAIPREILMDSLELGTPGKVYDAITASVNKASWENQMFIKGKNPPEPIDGDNHIVHWSEHAKIIEGKSFLEFSSEMRERLIEHIMVHEMEMMDKAALSPSFLQRLLQLDSFPKYYNQPQAFPEQNDSSETPPPRQAGRRGPVGGSAPGTPGADLERGDF